MKKEIKKQLKEKNKEKANYKWIVRITLFAFVATIAISYFSEIVIPEVNIIFAVIILFIFIALGVLFDMIGISVTSADEQPFHSMCSRKIKGAKIAVNFKKNAEKVSSFCNDVIGDICGIISGTIGITISLTLASKYNLSEVVVTLVITGLIAALTIGGKAMGKSIAINNSNEILYQFSKVVETFKSKI